MPKEFVKAPELAKLGNTKSSTIKYYAEEGLLEFHQTRPNSHKIFSLKENLKRLKKIKDLQERGYSIEMVKNKLSKKKPGGVVDSGGQKK